MDETNTLQFGELLSRYEAALAWYRELGASVRNSRLDHYAVLLRRLTEGHADPEIVGLIGRDMEVTNALYEAHQHSDIHSGLAGRYDAYVRSRIDDVARGPRLYVDELTTASSDRSRNIVFEMALASWFARSGFEIAHERTGDLTLLFGDTVLALECKRPQSIRGLERAVKDAGKQIKARLKHNYRSYVRSIVAVDATKMVNPTFGLLTAPTLEAGMQQLVDGLRRLSDATADGLIPLLPRKNLGLLLRVTSVAAVADRRYLTYCSQHLMTFYRVTGTANAPFADALSAHMRERGIVV